MDEEKIPESDLPASLSTADFSPDGTTLITASLGGILAEWDVATGERRRVLLDPKGIEDENPRLVAVRDGREVEAPFELRRLSECMRGSSLLSVRYSPDGKRFAVGAANGTVVIWNAESRGELFAWRAHECDVVALDVSLGRRWLATGALEAGGTTFKVWKIQEDPPDIKEAFSDCRHVGGVWAVCFSPDGRIVAAGGWTNSGYTMPLLYELESGKSAGCLHWDMTRAMRFSPDGLELVTGDEFGTVKHWVIEQHKPDREHKAHEGVVAAVGFSPDGERFFSAGGGWVKVWDKRDGRLLRQCPVDGRILAGRFADKGRVLLWASAVSSYLRPHIQRLELPPE